MTPEEQILTLASMAQDYQAGAKTLIAQGAESQKALKAYVDKAEAWKVEAINQVRQGATAAAQEALKAVVAQASAEIKAVVKTAAAPLGQVAGEAGEAAGKVQAAAAVISTRLVIEAAVIILMGLTVISGINWHVRRQVARLDVLQEQLAQAEQTRAKLNTWGVELQDYASGERWIILPQGAEFGREGKHPQDGRNARQVIGGKRQ